MKFRVLHTNDIHSNFKNFAKIKTLIDTYRNDETIILDAGDFADFKRMELLGTKGKIAGELLEAAHYDAITIGNNETFQGIEILERMASYSKVPFLSCNLFRHHQSIEHVKPYTIKVIHNVKFLIIGTSPVMPVFPELMGFTYKDYKKRIKDIISQTEHDVCILVNHIGTIDDETLANEISGIDIIISGHDHKLFTSAKVINHTIQNSAFQQGEYLGFIECSFENGKVTLIDSKAIPTEDVNEDQNILAILERNREFAYDYLSQPLYELPKTLYHDFIEECPIGNLIADGLRDTLKTDIGLINSGIVSGGLKKGNVSEKKLIDICPSPLNPTYFEIQGKHIKEALQISISPEVCLDSGKGAGFRGIALGKLHVSGVKVEYHRQSIKDIYVNDQKLDEEKYYTVAATDYLERNDVYYPLKNRRNSEYNVEYIRDTLREYLSKPDFVEQAFMERYTEV